MCVIYNRKQFSNVFLSLAFLGIKSFLKKLFQSNIYKNFKVQEAKNHNKSYDVKIFKRIL